MEFVARGMKGRIKEKLIVMTVKSFRVDFEVGMAFYRGFKLPKEVSTTLKEIRQPKAFPRLHNILTIFLVDHIWP